ncbi:hypothetical protein PV326_014027, partial [Microctonus aethiopoides]
PLNSGSRLEEIITKKTEEYIKGEFEQRIHKKYTNFSDNNPAHRPSNQELKDYLCNQWEVANIFKKLPNKTSTGVDKIPSIVLKHLPNNIVKEYTIIFNNALNNYYFPDDWKKAKVLAIPKTVKVGRASDW